MKNNRKSQSTIVADLEKEMTEPEKEYYEELAEEIGEAAIKGGKLPAVLTRDEVFILLEAPPEKKKRDRLIIRLLYATGIRVAELCDLKFCDIFYPEDTIFIRSGKGDKDRYVCADKRTFEMLKKWQGEKPLENNVIDIEVRQVRRVVDKYGEETEIAQKYEAMGRSFSPHSFRHSFATHCYENGMDLFSLKGLLGHKYLETTELYCECSMEQKKSKYKESHELAR